MVDPSSSTYAQQSDTVQCVHCQAHWVIDPGSGKQRGFCLRHAGPTCGGRRCETHCQSVEEMLLTIEANDRMKHQYDTMLREMAAERAPLG